MNKEKRNYGFSTGALAKGDWSLGITLQKKHAETCTAIELSALREKELTPLINNIPRISLLDYTHVSLHAPSELDKMSEKEVVQKLSSVREYIDAFIVHPNIIREFSLWRQLGSKLLIENMDHSSDIGKTAEDLEMYFLNLPGARLCLDMAHAEPGLTQCYSRLSDLIQSGNIGEIHISELDYNCKHNTLSNALCRDFKQFAAKIPTNVPIIIESVIAPDEIAGELLTVKRVFGE